MAFKNENSLLTSGAGNNIVGCNIRISLFFFWEVITTLLELDSNVMLQLKHCLFL